MKSGTRFTLEARAVLLAAQEEAQKRHNVMVDLDHVLLSLLNHNESPANIALEKTSKGILAARIADDLGQVRDEPLALDKMRGLSPDVKQMLTQAVGIAHQMKMSFVNSGHLLIGAIRSANSPLQDYLNEAGLQQDRVFEIVATQSPTPTEFAMDIPGMQPLPAKPIPAQAQPSGAGGSLLLYVGLFVIAIVIYLALTDPPTLISFGFVLGVWVFSVTLHEFAHAIVAYMGGDHTVKDKGYLTFNPLRYTHPLVSIILPIVFLLMGGIPLPGGAVYIEEHRLRSKAWRTAVSLAGPGANALMVIFLSAPFWLGIADEFSLRWQAALAFTVFLQIFAVILNLLPIPPLDGFRALSPWMSPELQRAGMQFGMFGLIVIFMLFGSPTFAEPFYTQIYEVMIELDVPIYLVSQGYDYFEFWE